MSACTKCGAGMNPVERMLGAICGACVRAAHAGATGGAGTPALVRVPAVRSYRPRAAGPHRNDPKCMVPGCSTQTNWPKRRCAKHFAEHIGKVLDEVDAERAAKRATSGESPADEARRCYARAAELDAELPGSHEAADYRRQARTAEANAGVEVGTYATTSGAPKGNPGALRPIKWTTEAYERGMPEMGRFHLATYGNLSASIRERPGSKVAWWAVNARGPGQKFGEAQHLTAVASHTAPSVAAAKREVRRVFDGDFPAEWKDRTE